MSYESSANHRKVVAEARDALTKHEVAYCFNKAQLQEIKELGFDIKHTNHGWYYSIFLKVGETA